MPQANGVAHREQCNERQARQYERAGAAVGHVHAAHSAKRFDCHL
ncbi:hypothetical protein [Lysobacter gummosus]